MCMPSALRNTEERKAAEFAKCARKFTRARKFRKFREFRKLANSAKRAAGAEKFSKFSKPAKPTFSDPFFQNKLHPNTAPLARNLHPQPKPEAEPRAQALLTLP